MTKPVLCLAFACAALVMSVQAEARPTPATPKGNPGLWVQTDDYPASALREEAEGVVRFKLDVDAAGVPVNCSVVQSSGRADLDDATCQLIKERARFEPATDTRGRPVASTYSNSVRWQIPQGHYVPPPGEMVTSLIVEKDGTVSSCTVEKADGAFAAGSEQMCKDTPTFEPILDKDGNPVRKRVRTTMKVEHEDLP